VVSFSTVPLMRGGQSFPLSLLMGVPGMGVDAGGRSRQMYVDTGAKLSYLSAEMAKGLTPTGTEEDFYPGMGRFETQVYEVEFSLGDLTFTLLCGVLPGMLETAMKVSGKEGIIGAGLFAQFTVELDAKGKQISLRA